MRQRFVISDTHFSHANIIKYCNRPFSCVEEMDEFMVDRWNAVVPHGARVWHLGDVAISKRALSIVKRLNGRLGLIPGNHDIYKAQDYLAAGFKDIQGMRVYPGVAVLTHVPIHPQNMGRWRLNVHGHIHDNPSPEGPYACVCVEQINYTPIDFDELLERFKHLPAPEKRQD